LANGDDAIGGIDVGLNSTGWTKTFTRPNNHKLSIHARKKLRIYFTVWKCICKNLYKMIRWVL